MQAAFPATDQRTASLFAGAPGGNSLVQAALSGMGRVLADRPKEPRCAVATVGDFVYCGGEPGYSAVHLLRMAMTGSWEDYLIYAPGAWRQALARLGEYQVVRRYAFDSHVQPEDDHLRALLRDMPVEGAFQPIEGAWIAHCRTEEWSRDFVRLYEDEAYAQRGLGVLLMLHGEAVAGASSYTSYPGGIEVQLQTRDDQQGKGYATLAAAKLLLMAHARGLIATWDAANATSAYIAEKLGYCALGTYEVAKLCNTKE